MDIFKHYSDIFIKCDCFLAAAVTSKSKGRFLIAIKLIAYILEYITLIELFTDWSIDMLSYTVSGIPN
jgi:hypothetical protein